MHYFMNNPDHPSKDHSIIYYIYSSSIARQTNSKIEVKNHQTDQWVEITDPVFWRRIVEQGMIVNQEEAEKMYHLYHTRIK